MPGPNAAGRVLRYSRTCLGQHPRRCGVARSSRLLAARGCKTLSAPGCRCARSRETACRKLTAHKNGLDPNALQNLSTRLAFS